MFSIPSPIACAKLKSFARIDMKPPCQYTTSTIVDKSLETYLNFWPFSTCASETVGCRYNFIPQPLPCTQFCNFSWFVPLSMYWARPMLFKRISIQMHIICCITSLSQEGLVHHQCSCKHFKNLIFFLAETAIDMDWNCLAPVWDTVYWNFTRYYKSCEMLFLSPVYVLLLFMSTWNFLWV